MLQHCQLNLSADVIQICPKDICSVEMITPPDDGLKSRVRGVDCVDIPGVPVPVIPPWWYRLDTADPDRPTDIERDNLGNSPVQP